ncbi:MAG: triose-phosphate isomerase [Candidatus Neomarinimicrobiota bacterium]
MVNTIVAGNWKMNKTPSEGKIFSEKMVEKLGSNSSVDIIICPPFTGLSSLVTSTKFHVGAQNCHFEDSGAYTGEISTSMLVNCKVEYVILGHSERRAFFHEKNNDIGKKVAKVLNGGMKPILCVGETIDELNEGLAKETVQRQLQLGLNDVNSLSNIVIAYEPVWAIGTGLTASVEKVSEIHSFIRTILKDLSSESESNNVPIIYGGSVNSFNADELINVHAVNGFLIGGASLDVDKFVEIINIVDKI